MTARHPNHDRILEALAQADLPLKSIAKRFGTTLNNVKSMKAKWIEETRTIRFHPGEGQLHFFNRFRRGSRKP